MQAAGDGQPSEATGPSYMKRLSYSLRQQMQGPVTRSNPTYEEESGQYTAPSVSGQQPQPHSANIGPQSQLAAQQQSQLNHTTLQIRPEANLAIRQPGNSWQQPGHQQQQPGNYRQQPGPQQQQQYYEQQYSQRVPSAGPLSNSSPTHSFTPAFGQLPPTSHPRRMDPLAAPLHGPLSGPTTINPVPEAPRKQSTPLFSSNVGFVQPRAPQAPTLPGGQVDDVQRQPRRQDQQRRGGADMDQDPQQPHYLEEQRRHERRGTRSGPYRGFASKPWLEAEMQKEVDEVAKHVNITVTQREQKTFATERTQLRKEISDLQEQKAELMEKIAKLELLMPNDNGEFVKLKRELDELEDDCDYYYKLYEGAAASKGADQEALLAMEGRIMDLEGGLAHMRAGIDPSTGGHLAGPMSTCADDIPIAIVTPEMVLAAERIVGRPPKKWPDWHKIAIRTMLAVILLGFVGGAIVLTYFLTRKYA